MSGLSNALLSGRAWAYGTGVGAFIGLSIALLGRAAVCISCAVVFFFLRFSGAFCFGGQFGLDIGLSSEFKGSSGDESGRVI